MKKLLSAALLLVAITCQAQYYNATKTIYVTTEGHVYGVTNERGFGPTIDATHELAFASPQAKMDTILHTILLTINNNSERAFIDNFNTQMEVYNLKRKIDSLERSQPIFYIDRRHPKKPQLWVKDPAGSFDIFIRNL